MKLSLEKLKPYLCLIVFWGLIMALNFSYSRDVLTYQCWFDDALELTSTNRFSSPKGYFHDPAFFATQGLGAALLPFEAFFSLLVFAALLLKLLALIEVTPNPTWLDVAPYVFVLSFLHEGTQVRVAIALSIALWALIYFVKDKPIRALLVLGVGAAFHVSVAAFLVVLLLTVVYKRFGLWPFIVMMGAAVFLSFSPYVLELVLQWGEAHQARYMAYAKGAIYRSQNSSGLFGYFPIFVGAITLMTWQLYKPKDEVWSKLKQIALISGFLAVVVLLVFRFNVVIASRLADLLLLPVVLVLGAALVQLKQHKRIVWLSLVMIFLVSYAAARGFVTFRPIYNESKICHPERLPGYIPAD